MRQPIILASAALRSACRGVEEGDRWRYERVVWEETPSVGSRDDARNLAETLAARPDVTLEDCYQMALWRSEALSIDGEELVRLQAQIEEAVGSILPRVAFRGSYTRQDDSGVVSSGSVARSFTLEERTEYRFVARQPLFSGLREVYAIRQGNAFYESREHRLRQARLLLFADVAEAFYLALQVRRDLETTQDTLALARERLEELVQRQRVGISRRSEVLAQEAEVASLEADVERLRGALAVAWEALRFLTGLAGTPALADSIPEPGDPGFLESYLSRALASRADLEAARREVAAREEAVGIARAGYLPTASLDANYYTHREGLSDSINWDLVVSLEVPVFEGTVTQARLRGARSDVRAAQFRLERLRREIELEVNRSYADLQALRSQLASLEKAVASAQENYDIVQAEYRRDIVTNVEVLAALDTLQRARLERDRARFQAKLAAVRLEVRSGSRPGGPR
jgi:outer membrane protein